VVAALRRVVVFIAMARPRAGGELVSSLLMVPFAPSEKCRMTRRIERSREKPAALAQPRHSARTSRLPNWRRLMRVSASALPHLKNSRRAEARSTIVAPRFARACGPYRMKRESQTCADQAIHRIARACQSKATITLRFYRPTWHACANLTRNGSPHDRVLLRSSRARVPAHSARLLYAASQLPIGRCSRWRPHGAYAARGGLASAAPLRAAATRARPCRVPHVAARNRLGGRDR
jgi:hypothetical protein